MDHNCCVCALPCQDDNWNGSAISKYLAINVPIKYSTLLLQIVFNGENLISYVSLKEDEVLCRTCIILLKKLYAYQCEIQSIEKMLLSQAMRINESLADANEVLGKVELPIKWSETFIQRKDGLISCRKCTFLTNYADMVEPHLILHSSESSENSYAMLRNDTERISVESDCIMDLIKTNNNDDEESEQLPKQPLRTYSKCRARYINNNALAEHHPNPILKKSIDVPNDSTTVLNFSGPDINVKRSKTQANKRKTVHLPSERFRKCASCGQVIRSIDVCDHMDAKASMNCKELHCEVNILRRNVYI